MNLPFSLKIGAWPTHFPEKILNGLYWPDGEVDEYFAQSAHHPDIDINLALNPDTKAKIHTIREDPTDRWKPGSKIHFVIHNRSKKRFQFAPVLEVKSVQKIEVRRFGGEVIIWIDNSTLLHPEDVNTLAVNDGFPSAMRFLQFFDRDFKGKIIHWADHRYS